MSVFFGSPFMINFTIFIVAICLQGMVICLVMLYRNNLISQYRAKAIGIAYEYSVKAINKGDHDYEKIYGIKDSYGTYDEMLLGDLRKWKFEDFYPFIEDRMVTESGINV